MSTENGQQATVELPPAPAPEVKPTTTDLKDQGLDPREIKMAEDQGLVEKDAPADKPKDQSQDATAGTKPKKDDQPAGLTKEQIHERIKNIKDLTPEQETELLNLLDKNGQGLYWAQKKERKKRQLTEIERDQAKARAAELEKALKEAVEKAKPKGDGLDLDDLLDDDPDAKPKDGKDPAKKEGTDAPKETEAEKTKRAELLNARLEEIEVVAKETRPDFDQVTDLAKELMAEPEKFFKGEDLEKFYDHAVLIVQRTKGALDYKGARTAAVLAYELGKMHPNYKPNGAGQPPKGAEKDADLTPEIVDKQTQNAQRRSSAALNGGGAPRIVSEDDITPEMAVDMSKEQFAKLKPATRERLLRA